MSDDLPSSFKRAETEYASCRASIANYDEFLFKIRSWNITVTTALIGGYISFSKAGDQAVSASMMVMVSCLVISGFWFLDAMTKSFQMVFIYASRDLERYLRRGLNKPLISPSTSLRFAKKQGRHLRATIKGLTDESIWPFYLICIVATCGVAALRSAMLAKCTPLLDCGWDADRHVAWAGVAVPIAMLALSILSNRRWPPFRYILAPRRWRRHLAVQRVLRAIRREDEAKLIETPKRRWPYKADAWSEGNADFAFGGLSRVLLFVDGPSRMRDEGYRVERANLLGGLGWSVIAVDERCVRRTSYAALYTRLDLAKLLPKCPKPTKRIIDYHLIGTTIHDAILNGLETAIVAPTFVKYEIHSVRRPLEAEGTGA